MLKGKSGTESLKLLSQSSSSNSWLAGVSLHDTRELFFGRKIDSWTGRSECSWTNGFANGMQTAHVETGVDPRDAELSPAEVDADVVASSSIYKDSFDNCKLSINI